ncbi:hypothetical protein GGQ85_004120 [Nitrobacter vulgaris]|nr:hypothetical protein [Nitrobacter vulgaris]
MKWKLPPSVHGYINRHGKAVFYYRVPGSPKVRLRGHPGSDEFMLAYDLAKAGDRPKVELGSGRTKPGTVNAALVSYYQSSAFRDGLTESSQKMRRAILERFREAHGDKRVALMTQAALQNIINKKTPAGALNFRKAMRGFLDHCLSLNFIKADPLAGVKLVEVKSAGHHTWIAEECRQFEAHHKIGTRERLAYELLLQASQSRCDVVRMGRQHVRNGMMTMGRQKTGVLFNVQVTPSLQQAIEAMPVSNHMTYLLTSFGKPFTAAVSETGFGKPAMTPSCRIGVPRMDCARRQRHTSQSRARPTINLWHGSGGLQFRRRRFTPRRRIGSVWRKLLRGSLPEQALAHPLTR